MPEQCHNARNNNFFYYKPFAPMMVLPLSGDLTSTLTKMHKNVCKIEGNVGIR